MRITIGFLLPLSLLAACTEKGTESTESTEGAARPYTLGQALVIGESPEGQLVTVSGTCDTETCVAVRERCGDEAYAEVVVDADGSVLDVVCFPGNATFQEIGPDAVASASAGNNAVLVFDDADDGADVTGDVALTGNNSVIYGKGADVSRIGGTVSLEKNNAVVRGVSIGGDLRIDKNNAQLSFVEILGDLVIDGNNTTLAGSIVHGQVTINGVNTVLVQNKFFSVTSLAGKNLECNGNVSVAGSEPTPAADAGISTDAGAAPGASDAGIESPLACENRKGSPDADGNGNRRDRP